MRCLHCKNPIKPCNHKSCLVRGRKFCSPACHHTFFYRKPDKTCACCKKKFHPKKNYARQQYCSTKCRYQHMIGPLHPRWKNARTLDKSGYIVVWHNRKLLKEHRVVMEQKLGRPLSPHEFVHHKNHIRSDNRIENLAIMSNSEHARHHNLERHAIIRLLA